MTLAKTDFSLRPVALGDAARVAELIGDWEVVRWLSGPPHPYALADAVEFLQKLHELQAAPARLDAIIIDGQFAGAVGIDQRSHGLNIGYWLGRPYWGLGIMTGAATELTRDFFANSSETKLNSGYFSGNEPSWAIQRRLGFEFVSEGSLFNRPHGKRLPHVETVLTRERFETLERAKA